jgi:hypothetical protein
MGRKSITGGVMPAGISRIRFDFSIDGQRFRPALPLIPNETNLRCARRHLTRIKAQIEAGTFCFADEFPRYRGLQKLPRVLQSRSCGEVFDDFLRHEEATGWYNSSMSTKLSSTNPYLRDPATRKSMVIRSVVTSSAIEGIRASFKGSTRGNGKSSASKGRVKGKKA